VTHGSPSPSPVPSAVAEPNDAEPGMHTRTTVRPGALTALLGELARAPDATGWSIPAEAGERIGRFEIVREIGRGGFGVVYEARDTELGRSVAFKAIRVGASDAVRERRALAEAEAAARLAHPNIVHLYDLGRTDRGAFLIMELLAARRSTSGSREAP